MATKVNKKWFTDLLAKRGLSQRDAASLLGISQATVSQMLEGRRRMPINEAPLWASMLQSPVGDILKNAGIEVETEDLFPSTVSKQIKVAGWVDEDLTVHEEPTAGLRFVSNPTGQNDVSALHCRTPKGDFERMDGAILYYPSKIKGFDPDAIGRISLVEIKGGTNPLIRIVKRGYQSGCNNLALINEELKEENVVIEKAVPILWMKL